MNKKIKAFVGFLLLSIFVISFSSCSSCSSKQDKNKPGEAPVTAFEQTLTNQDSVQVTQEIDHFFTLWQNNKLDEAVAMLYKADNDDRRQEPRVLNNQEIAAQKGLMNSIRVASWNIDFLKFSESDDNEAKVTVTMNEATESSPALTTVFYFKPVKVVDVWKLCIVDSHNSDHPVVNGDKQDSVEKAYQNKLRQQAQSQSQSSQAR